MSGKISLGQRIKTMRLSRGMTQADLARAIDQSQSSITMYETGRRDPDYETLEALADVFNVPLSSFFDDGSSQLNLQYFSSAQSPEIHIVSGMMEKMSKEQQEQVVAVLRAMFSNHPELLK